MDVRIEEGWKNALSREFEKDYFKNLTDQIRREYAEPGINVYPPASKIFAAFDNCPFDNVKVVIIGQDPYHGPGQANGLCFSVNPGVTFPPSLRNIFKEVCADTGAPYPGDGDLTRWARQGVLLLNSALTVREHQPKSHSGIGWEQFADAVVKAVNDNCENVVFLLWGSDAIKRGSVVDRTKHLVLQSVHPSPLSASRGFFGNHHFSKANSYLKEKGRGEIIW
ncbi:MAG: uracil-DNA glycosylase [Bacteroidales bacterium]|nr:uracil-DNA glycosylase [Bacteroidales bacterium]MDE6256397.1 uracil-DNA glycosylase [Muribaculaceae bacterium]